MRWILITAALLGASSVIIGAMVRHMAGAPDTYDILQTGIRYHQIHSVVLMSLGLFSLIQGKSRTVIISAVLFISGILFFSGSLYLSVVFELPALAKVMPIGGMCFIAGWLSLGFIRTIKTSGE